MKLFFSILLLFLAAFASETVVAQTQAEMNATAAKRLQRLDAQLNKIYQALIAEHAGEDGYVANLKEAQRAWLKYVDMHLKTVFPVEDGENPRVVYGSMYPLEFAEHKAEMVKVRIEELQALREE